MHNSIGNHDYNTLWPGQHCNHLAVPYSGRYHKQPRLPGILIYCELVTSHFCEGHRGLVGLFINKFTMMPRVGGSKLSLSSFFRRCDSFVTLAGNQYDPNEGDLSRTRWWRGAPAGGRGGSSEKKERGWPADQEWLWERICFKKWGLFRRRLNGERQFKKWRNDLVRKTLGILGDSCWKLRT